MDSSAIEAITDNAAIQDLNRTITNHNVFAVPNSAKLESLERFDSRPEFFRANFKTTVLDEYITYINQNANNHSGIFINPDLMQAVAIIDLGEHLNPQWGKHKAHALLKKSPAYTALLNQQNAQ
jgi:uncharacterized protein YfdQ (DUF2303 family)